jgi:hypothetical protein
MAAAVSVVSATVVAGPTVVPGMSVAVAPGACPGVYGFDGCGWQHPGGDRAAGVALHRALEGRQVILLYALVGGPRHVFVVQCFQQNVLQG